MYDKLSDLSESIAIGRWIGVYGPTTRSAFHPTFLRLRVGSRNSDGAKDSPRQMGWIGKASRKHPSAKRSLVYEARLRIKVGAGA